MKTDLQREGSHGNPHPTARIHLTLGSAAAAWPLAAWAQQGDRMRRVAMLSGLAENDPEAEARVIAFHLGLKELGWIAGRNLHIDFRWSTSDAAKMQAAAKELVERKPELIVGITTPAVDALVKATNTIPVVFAAIVDRCFCTSAAATCWRRPARGTSPITAAAFTATAVCVRARR